MEEFSKRCWTEINRGVIVQNYRVYKNLLPNDSKIMAVVKADAYGHGDVETALALQNEGARDFAVATIEEAIKLRQNGIKGQILILSYAPLCQAEKLTKYDITQTVTDEFYAEKLSEIAPNAKVHFALDTGMNRIGIDADDAEYCERKIREYKEKLNVTGIFTHLCAADSDDKSSADFTKNQIKKFEAVAEQLQDLNLPYVHCLNSAGGLRYRCEKSVFARLGIVLYGLKPSYSNVLPDGIKPALSWHSVVSVVKKVRRGEKIGYGGTFVAKKEMKIATICAGYADGYNRLLSNKFYVLINGKKAAITGRICMDQFMADVTDVPNVKMGTKVVLIGTSGDETITADDMANAIGTIGYEIVCNISKRVERVEIPQNA